MKTSRNTNGNGRSQGKGNGNGRDGHNQKGKYFYPKYLQEKLAITVLVITLALFALIMVLYRIIRDNNEQYKKIVLTQRQQEYESRVIPYRRGDIVDRNGTYLATSEKVYNLIIDPRQIMSAPERYLEPTIETLVASFGFDAGELRAMIEEKKDSAYLRYSKGRQLTYDQRTAFEQLAKEKNDAYIKNKDEVEGRKRVKGVWFEDEYKRIYPYNLSLIHILKGMDLENVQFVKLFQNAQDVIEKLKDASIRKIAVVGAGYIGVELAEAFRRNGREVVLIDCAETCLSGYYDREFSDIMTKNLMDHGVKLAFGETVTELEGDGKVQKIITDKGSHEADMVVFGIGFKPNTVLGQGQLRLYKNHAFLVDRKQETSIPGVYAIGDCATVYNNAIQATDYIALATNAVRSGIIAAHNACGRLLESPGVQGSNGISIWGLHMLSTGISLARAERLGYKAGVTDYEDWQKAEFMENGNNRVKIRIVYDMDTRIILGAQMCSDYDISMGIHLFSMAIEEQVDIDKLKLFDLFFLPHFNKPYNYITMAALAAR